jgi:branched-chain amino acid transport system substrate-binding protein
MGGVVFGRLFTVVAMLAGAAGCERRHPAVIGVAFGEDHPNVLDVAREELQRRYADSAPRIFISTEPAEAGAPGAATFATRLTQIAGLVGVVGHADSRGTLVAAPVYDEAHIPLLAPTATSRRLRTATPWVFMMAPDDSIEAEFIADFAVRSLHTRAVAVFYDNDEYGIGLRDALRGAFAARRLQPIAEEPIATPCGAPELGEASIVRAAPAGHLPDLAVIAGRSRDAACLGRRMSERVRGLRIIGADGVEHDSTFDVRFGAARAPFYTVAVWHSGLSDSASVVFAHDYQRIVGMTPLASNALVFDAVMVLAIAAHTVGNRPAAIRRYLADLGSSRPAYQGITGPVAFGPGARRPLYMVRIGAQ